MAIHDVLAELPTPDRLRNLSKALALLDLAVCPDDAFQDRYFRFEPAGADGIALASMENGSGDQYFIAFDDEATFEWGFAHESAMTPYVLDPIRVWPGVLDGPRHGSSTCCSNHGSCWTALFWPRQRSGQNAASLGAPGHRTRPRTTRTPTDPDFCSS